jgi:hypothetical protein
MTNIPLKVLRTAVMFPKSFSTVSDATVDVPSVRIAVIVPEQ